MKIYRKLLNLLKIKRGIDEVGLVYKVLRSKGGESDIPVMIDVGAHYGSSLKRFAEDGWQVYAIEPDKENRERLLAKYGDYSNIAIDDRAISDKEARNLPFFTSDVSTGISGLSRFDESHKESGTVTATTLDNFISEKEIKNVDFLKIDTEGYDLFVLKGLGWTAVSPDVVVCEFENNKTEPLGYQFNDIARFLQEKGYSILVSEWYPIVRYGGNHRWRRFGIYPCDLVDNRGWGNIIGCKDEKIFKKLCATARNVSITMTVRGIIDIRRVFGRLFD